MNGAPERSIISRIVMGSLGLLVATIALSLALELLTKIWPWLVGIAILSGAVAVVGWVIRRRRQRW